jgi:hypothetical protein
VLANGGERWGESLKLAHSGRLVRKMPLHNLPEANTMSSRAQVGKFVNDHRLKTGGGRHHESPGERDRPVG